MKTRICLAQADDDAPTFGTIHKGHEKQGQANVTNAALARLAIHPTSVGPRHRRTTLHVRHPGQRSAMLDEVGGIFGDVERGALYFFVIFVSGRNETK